jgi:hypothetical protein
MVSRLTGINAAKLNVTPVDPKSLLTISIAIESMPRCDRITRECLVKYLKGHMGNGAGIKMLICMLAVETKGSYAPMDNKFAAGLRSRHRIDEEQENDLNSDVPDKFATVYVDVVMPVWRATRRKKSGPAADGYWCTQ